MDPRLREDFLFEIMEASLRYSELTGAPENSLDILND